MITRIAFIGVLAALLAGCGPKQVIVYGGAGRSDNTAIYFRYAARDGAIYTQVVGQPFQTDPQRLQRAVVGLMSGYNFGPSTDFVAEHSQRTDPAFRVVVAFNPVPTVSSYTLCEKREKSPVRGPGNPVTVRMAFCMGDYALSGVSAEVGHLTGPEDPAFAELVQQALLSLVPIERFRGDD